MFFSAIIEPILNIFLKENLIRTAVYSAWKTEFQNEESVGKAVRKLFNRFIGSLTYSAAQFNQQQISTDPRARRTSLSGQHTHDSIATSNIRKKRLHAAQVTFASNASQVVFEPTAPSRHVRTASRTSSPARSVHDPSFIYFISSQLK